MKKILAVLLLATGVVACGEKPAPPPTPVPTEVPIPPTEIPIVPCERTGDVGPNGQIYWAGDCNVTDTCRRLSGSGFYVGTCETR